MIRDVAQLSQHLAPQIADLTFAIRDTVEPHCRVLDNPPVFAHWIPDDGIGQPEFPLLVQDQITALVDAWKDLGPPLLPGNQYDADGRATVTDDTRRTAIGYAGRAALAMNSQQPWEIPIFRCGGYEGDHAKWTCFVNGSVGPHYQSINGFDANPWINFYFSSTETTGITEEDRQVMQKIIGYIMSNIQDGLDYEANQRRTNRRPDKPVEFDHWDVLYWLPRAYQTGVLSDTEYTRYLEIMRSYKYLPSTPGSYHSVLYFSATEDPMLTVRATVSNTPSLDHFLCRYFTPDGRREAIEAAILPSGRTGIIEISRLLYGDLSALRAVGSMRRLMGGISKLKGLAGSHTGLTVFAEVHEKLRKRLGFDKTLPLNNGTTLSLQVGPD